MIWNDVHNILLNEEEQYYTKLAVLFINHPHRHAHLCT